MAVKVKWNDEAFAINLRLACKNVTDEVTQIFDEEAALIQLNAVYNAPRKDRFLEEAIGVQVIEQEKGVYTVAIGVEEGAENGRNYPIEAYAERLEHGQESAGNQYKRGPGTVAKGPQAGGSFMHRAVFERVGTMASRVKAAITRGVKRAQAAKVATKARRVK